MTTCAKCGSLNVTCGDCASQGFLKPFRVRLESFLVFIRNQDCAAKLTNPRHVCEFIGDRQRIEAAHLKTRGAGGSDFCAIPLCPLMHDLQENYWDKFADVIGCNPYELALYYVVKFFTGGTL